MRCVDATGHVKRGYIPPCGQETQDTVGAPRGLAGGRLNWFAERTFWPPVHRDRNRPQVPAVQPRV